MYKAGVSKASRAAHSRLANFMKKPRMPQDAHSTNAWKGDQTYSLMQHTPQFSMADLVLSKDLFPEAQEGDVLELIPEDRSIPFVLQVTSSSLASGKNLTISVNKQVSTAFNIPGRDFLIRVQKLISAVYEIEAIVFSIKDQFISRRDMSKIEAFCIGKAFFKTQKVSLLGAKLQITDILVMGKAAMSGVVTKKTQVTFRSKSCRIIWLIEMTKEMWTFTEEGLLLFDKALSFIRCALERSSLTGASHNISVIAYARLFFPTVSNEEAALHQLSSSTEGAYYMDVCKEICDVTDLRTSWKSTFPSIKRELFEFLRNLNWTVDVPSLVLKAVRHTPLSLEAVRLPSRLSTSQETCVLEVINMALNRFEYHAQDRKLANTGQCILIISAGVGAYYAKQSFVRLTKERVTNCAVNLDIVSVNYRPLHLTPVFIYTLEKLRETRDKAREVQDKETYEMYLCYSDSQPATEKSASYPTWLRLHFFYSVAQLEGTSNIQSALHNLTLTRAMTQMNPLVSFSCFEESAMATLNYVSSKLSYSLKDTLLPLSGRAVSNLQTEINSPLLGSQPQTFDQTTIKTHLKAFCRAFDNRVFSYRREDEPPKDSEHFKADPGRKSDLVDKRVFRGTIIGGMQPAFFYDQIDGGMKRKFSEDSSDSSKDSGQKSDSPRRNSIHDWTWSKARSSLMNPFTSSKHEKKRHSRFNRRWARLFPGTVPLPPDTVEKDEFCEKSLIFFENVWRLLLEPALLPLTSDFWPGNEELGNSNPCQSSVSPSSNMCRDTLVQELVNLRLQKEFQLVTHPIDRFGRKVALNPNDLYLSRGSCNHVIMPSLQNEYNVDFRFYTSTDPPPDTHISVLVYNYMTKAFVLKEFSFSCAQTEWGRLDSIILGHVPKTELPMTDTTKCIKMVLLPRNFHGVDHTTEIEEAHQMEDFVTFHRLLQEALSREQQKASGDEKERVEIEVLPMRNPQESLSTNSFVLKFEEPEEWITIEHDAIFKPNFAFSITLTWICGLGPAVAERVNLMKRKAEQAGLSLIQIPLWDGYQMKNPFRPRIVIRLVQPNWMRICLQSSLLEMLEMSPDFLIHKTGAVIAKIAENELFFQENYMVQTEEKLNYYRKIMSAALAHEVIKDTLGLVEKKLGLSS